MLFSNIYDMVSELTERILSEELLKTLRKTAKSKKNDTHLLKLMDKIRKEKRLKSTEFLSLHSMLWKSGPTATCQSPEKLERISRDTYYSKR